MRAVTQKQPDFRVGDLRHRLWLARLWLALNAGAMLALAACGGGGGGDDGGSDPPPPQEPEPPANTAPVANAGSDQEITLPTNSVDLTGSATDAEGPASSLTYEWSVTTGSGVTFSSPASAATTATFAAEGTYVLTLTVSDGSLSDTDTVQVTVHPAVDAGNEAPVVSAGTDQTIELPFATTVTLAGSATDDGAPDALTYSWTATGGTAEVTFDDAAAASTVAHFSAAGSYELTLTVGDSTDTGSDTLIVTVNPAVYPAVDDDSADGGWLRVAAADVGMDQTLLDQASTFALTGGTGTTLGGSGMIVRHGRLVHSWGDIQRRFDVKSTTKSIGGIALGLAIEQGLVALADIAQTHLPEIGNPPVENVGTGWLDDITVLQLATHTAGFEKPGGYVKLAFQPGTTWSYSDGGLNWLADMLTGPLVFNQDLNDVLAPVWSTLGVTLALEDGTATCGDSTLSGDVCWRANVQRPGPHPSGIEHRELAAGIWIDANAMARIGLLFLRNGLWANDQRVVSDTFVHTVHTPPPEVATAVIARPDAFPNATSNYGVLWWTNATGSTGLLPNVPADAYWAWGLGDSLIIVIPSLDLVIVRAGVQTTTPSDGRIWNDNDWDGNYAVLAPFIDPIVQAVTQP